MNVVMIFKSTSLNKRASANLKGCVAEKLQRRSRWRREYLKRFV